MSERLHDPSAPQRGRVIPSRDNPYTVYHGEMSIGRMPRPRTLTLRDLEIIVEEHEADLRAEFAMEKRDAQAAAWDEGRVAGIAAAMRLARAGVESVWQRELQHVVRKLREQPSEFAASEAEEAWLKERADEIEHALSSLLAMTQAKDQDHG